MNSTPENRADNTSRKQRVELHNAMFGNVLYGLIFFAIGAYLAWYLVRGISSGSAFGAGIVFMVRACFAVWDSVVRVIAIRRQMRQPQSTDATAEPSRRKTSAKLFLVGDLIVVCSVGLMALLVLTTSSGISGVPMGLGMGIGYLFYLVAIPMRIAGK